ncbi:MAG: hypothetical protein WCV99_20855 [Sterolibacterium sp.]
MTEQIAHRRVCVDNALISREIVLDHDIATSATHDLHQEHCLFCRIVIYIIDSM